MSSLRERVDEIPVTLVVLLAYATLAVLTGMFDDPREFAERLQRFGMLAPTLAATGEPWRLLAHAFLHGGGVHLAFNALMLWSLGPALERSLGSIRFAALYVVAALGGGLAVCLVYDPEQPVVGGSGAIFGMMGAAVAMNMRSGRHALAFLEFEGPRRLLGLIVANLVLGLLIPMVSNTAHVGGLLAGFAVTLLWLRAPAPSAALRRWRLALLALFAAATFASLVPATRHDWLWWRSEHTADADRRAALRRAAVLSRPDAFVLRDRADERDDRPQRRR